MNNNKKALLEATENLKDSFRYFIEVLENIEYDDNQYYDLYKYLIVRELQYMERLSNKKLAELL